MPLILTRNAKEGIMAAAHSRLTVVANKNQKANHTTKKDPLILQHALAAANNLEHDSHASHASHASHFSHYSNM